MRKTLFPQITNKNNVKVLKTFHHLDKTTIMPALNNPSL